MKYCRWLVVLLCVALLFGSLPQAGYAYERKGHDNYMLEVLFHNFKEIGNDPDVKQEIEALKSASYLAIDQFNSYGQKDLDLLLSYGVKGIPTEINEISFTASGTTHRSYTHRGWDHVYIEEKGKKWPIRKQILLNTADKIFDFQGNEAKQNSFCALIYYIHILGDHMDDSSYTVRNGSKMDIGGRRDKEDVTHELIKHIRILFKDQNHTHKYRCLINAITRYDNKLAEIVRSEGGINSDEKFAQKKEYTEGLMELLTLYIPEMLKEEAFFYDVFYG